jgi:hypothetical protein
MTEPDPDAGSGPEPGAAERAAPRRRLAALGDISVERSADDGDDGWSESDGTSDQDGRDRDDVLRREVPPHHG